MVIMITMMMMITMMVMMMVFQMQKEASGRPGEESNIELCGETGFEVTIIIIIMSSCVFLFKDRPFLNGSKYPAMQLILTQYGFVKCCKLVKYLTCFHLVDWKSHIFLEVSIKVRFCENRKAIQVMFWASLASFIQPLVAGNLTGIQTHKVYQIN